MINLKDVLGNFIVAATALQVQQVWEAGQATIMVVTAITVTFMSHQARRWILSILKRSMAIFVVLIEEVCY